ncbi:MAG: hypothetical protein VKM92_00235, partial [Cyanobacteriota bacterium]|nr:hypothetical protein [Cyanobacteriota bacterium]
AIDGFPAEGSELSYDLGCPNAYIEWRLVDDVTGEYSIVSSGVAATYIVASAATAAGKSIVGVGRCPDPSSPDGYGPAVASPPVKVFAQVRLTQTIQYGGASLELSVSRQTGFRNVADGPFLMMYSSSSLLSPTGFSGPYPSSVNIIQDCNNCSGQASVGDVYWGDISTSSLLYSGVTTSIIRFAPGSTRAIITMLYEFRNTVGGPITQWEGNPLNP